MRQYSDLMKRYFVYGIINNNQYLLKDISDKNIPDSWLFCDCKNELPEISMSNKGIPYVGLSVEAAGVGDASYGIDKTQRRFDYLLAVKNGDDVVVGVKVNLDNKIVMVT